MPNVLALFDDAQKLERAKSAMEEAGAGDEVVRVFRAAQPAEALHESPATRKGEERVVSQQGEVAATGAPTGSAADFDLEPFGEPGQFFWEAHQRGAHLMVLDATDPEGTAERLADAGAQRVHTV